MKTRKELKYNRDMWKAQALVWALGFFVLAIAFIVSDGKADELKTQLSDCQDEIPIRQSVLFVKCDDGTLLNLLVDENNQSLYDYEIKKGCEVIE